MASSASFDVSNSRVMPPSEVVNSYPPASCDRDFDGPDFRAARSAIPLPIDGNIKFEQFVTQIGDRCPCIGIVDFLSLYFDYRQS